jgi:hypothetical protein
VRRRAILVLGLALVAVAACTRQRSIYLQPGRRDESDGAPRERAKAGRPPQPPPGDSTPAHNFAP